MSHAKMLFLQNLDILKKIGIGGKLTIFFREKKKDLKSENTKEEIFKLRLSHMKFQLRNTPKGDIMSMFWKEKHIEDYIGLGLPSQ